MTFSFLLISDIDPKNYLILERNLMTIHKSKKTSHDFE